MGYDPYDSINRRLDEQSAILKQILSAVQPPIKQSLLLKFLGLIKRIRRSIRVAHEIRWGERCPIHKIKFSVATHPDQVYCGVCFLNIHNGESLKDNPYTFRYTIESPPGCAVHSCDLELTDKGSEVHLWECPTKGCIYSYYGALKTTEL